MNPEAKLHFGELKEGEKFISFPVPGDNVCHGGLKGIHYIFLKIEKIGGRYGIYDNSINLFTGTLHNMPDSMPVIQVA